MKAILAERRGPSLWLTIKREERRNAINRDVIEGLQRALRDLAPEIRAIVLTGAGSKAFCAGADLGGGTATFAAAADEPTTDFGRLARTVRDLGVPMIARVNGDCVAGGMGLLGLCDLAVAADHARFGLPETKVGVFPMQVLVYLRGQIHQRHINELCLTADLIDAARARDMGLVNFVLPLEALDAEIDRLVARIAAGSPIAVRRGKLAIAAMQMMAFPEALAFAEAQIALAARSSDAAEGISAFNEKRPPRWSGK
jgi:enoyl-CoA hydratase/carnithine racemase